MTSFNTKLSLTSKTFLVATLFVFQAMHAEELRKLNDELLLLNPPSSFNKIKNLERFRQNTELFEMSKDILPDLRKAEALSMLHYPEAHYVGDQIIDATKYFAKNPKPLFNVEQVRNENKTVKAVYLKKPDSEEANFSFLNGKLYKGKVTSENVKDKKPLYTIINGKLYLGDATLNPEDGKVYTLDKDIKKVAATYMTDIKMGLTAAERVKMMKSGSVDDVMPLLGMTRMGLLTNETVDKASRLLGYEDTSTSETAGDVSKLYEKELNAPRGEMIIIPKGNFNLYKSHRSLNEMKKSNRYLTDEDREMLLRILESKKTPVNEDK